MFTLIKSFLRQSPLGLLLVTAVVYGLFILMILPINGREVIKSAQNLLVTTKSTEYKINDILALKNISTEPSLVQVVAVKPSVDEPLYEVQGYSSSLPNKFLVEHQTIKGKVDYSVKQGALALAFMQTPEGYVALTGFPILLLLAEISLRSFKNLRQSAIYKKSIRTKRKLALQPMGVNYPSASLQSVFNILGRNSNEIYNRYANVYKLSQN